tara:strand:+ start:85 stop:1386 length:1302 start_codon:yes stop_codon:yes gene_type:complete
MMNNFNEITTDENSFSEDFENFLSNRNLTTNEVSKVVAGIISQVRKHGDKALKAYTKEFDGFETEDFLVTNKEKDFALNHVDSNLVESLEYSFEKILSYQTKCFESLDLENPEEAVTRKFRVIESIGMYIPGGKASYPSTVLMASAPAIACGIKNISITSPAHNGALDSKVIAAAKISGVENIFKIGGAQAIAALALGTNQISKVEKIIGPGNVFVAEAKKQLFGEVGIDSIAGPSEILVLADKTSDPETIAWDLMAQSEHDSDASSILISDSQEIIQKVQEIINQEIEGLERCEIIKEAFRSNGLMIKIRDISEAKTIINRLAPEHLHIAFDHRNYKDENLLIAGLILKGRDSANSLSDYVLGPSHILPTNSSSRFSSPLSVEDFLVSYSYISLNKSNDLVQYEEYVKHTINIANAEGLTAHALAAKKRLKN